MAVEFIACANPSLTMLTTNSFVASTFVHVSMPSRADMVTVGGLCEMREK